MQRKDLDGLSKNELILKAESLGVTGARTRTVPELVDEILLAAERKSGVKKPRGWFGRARDLLTSVIDRGLALPDAARKRPASRVVPAAPPPLATVTLAEIYAAQGHVERAIGTLDEVLAREPGRADARRLRDKLQDQLARTKPASSPPPSARAVVGPHVDVGPAVEGAAAQGAPPPSPAPPPVVIDRPPASQRPMFDTDDVVAVAVDPGTIYLYWEVRPRTLAAARAKAPDGALVVRVLGVSSGRTGPETDQRDIRVDALYGELFVRGLPPGTQVRISVGYKTAAGYEPFAVGIDLSTPRALPVRDTTQTFRRFSEARARAEDAVFDPKRAPPPPVPITPLRADAPGPLPRGVWADPAQRLVRVATGGGPAGQVRQETVGRLPGSSELFRRVSVWSRAPYAGADSTAMLGRSDF